MSDWPQWLRFRPIVMWPREQTQNRERSLFSAPLSNTLSLLARELDKIHRGGEIVLQVALREDQLRLDGRPRANQRAEHPGVILAFESIYGPLEYASDSYLTWEENLRAIAKTMEAQRAMARWGATRHGQQYQGWKQIGAGPTMSQREAAEFILHLTAVGDGVTPEQLITDREIRTTVLRAAAKRAHPDAGGSSDLWNKLAQAKALLPT